VAISRKALGEVATFFALTIAHFQGVAHVDASPSFVSAAVQLPAKTKTGSQLVALAERGIRADDVAAIDSYGYHPTLEQFIRRAGAGILASYIARLRAGGYTDANVDDLIELREGG
jgi:hypothetical protein